MAKGTAIFKGTVFLSHNLFHVLDSKHDCLSTFPTHITTGLKKYPIVRDKMIESSKSSNTDSSHILSKTCVVSQNMSCRDVDSWFILRGKKKKVRLIQPQSFDHMSACTGTQADTNRFFLCPRIDRSGEYSFWPVRLSVSPFVCPCVRMFVCLSVRTFTLAISFDW